MFFWIPNFQIKVPRFPEIWLGLGPGFGLGPGLVPRVGRACYQLRDRIIKTQDGSPLVQEKYEPSGPPRKLPIKPAEAG